MVAVPWAVYSPSTDLNVLTVTVDRDRIYNAPVFDYARIEEYSRPDYITNVYSYYGVSPERQLGLEFPAVLQRPQPAQPRQQGAATGAGAQTGAAATARPAACIAGRIAGSRTATAAEKSTPGCGRRRGRSSGQGA